MKKMAFVLAVLLFGAWLVSAQEENKDNAPELKPLSDWTPFQIGFLPGIPSVTSNSNVCGLKIGILMVDGYGRTYGFEPSVLYSGTEHIKGFQATVGASIAKEVYGFQLAGAGPAISKKVYGLQISGLANVTDDMKGFELGVANIAKNLYGFQASAVNIAEKVIGFQASVVNLTAELKGLQIGAFNYSKKSGIQIGVVNIIDDGWIPFTILFNIKF